MPKTVHYRLHAEHPERPKVRKIVDAVSDGAVMLYPTDTVYALGCDPRNKEAVERLRLLKTEMERKFLTLLCPSLAAIATYANIDDQAFKLIKSLTPGPFTFILKGTKEVPRLVLNPKRKTVGLRIPDHRFCQMLLTELGFLLVSTSARPVAEIQVSSKAELLDQFRNRVDIIVEDDARMARIPSTVIDLTKPEFEIVREGLGMERLTSHLKS